MIQQIPKKLISIAALFSCIALHANNVTPTLTFRSQGFHGDRQRNVGQVGKIYLYDMIDWAGVMDLGIGYMRSFHDKDIARNLFGCDFICDDTCKNTIKVQGSEVASRDAKAWLADYLYLNCDYDGFFSLEPRIQNVVVDLDFYLGLDQWIEGLYFRMYGPINWTNWETRFCTANPETVETTSCSTGYFTPSGSETYLSKLEDYFAGCAPATVDSVVFQGLKYAKMPICDETKLGFAELRAELGYNFLQDADYHLGIAAHVAAPTGNKRKAEYVMYPVVGNGNHWEIGGALHGHYVFWRSDNEERQCGFYVDAVFTHLFRATEERTFDLCCKDNSRYMLAARFTHDITNGANGLSGNANAGASSTKVRTLSQFDNMYAPVANLTTSNVKVSVDLQADIVAMLNFQQRGFSWDLGYNFWMRSAEHIECPRECNPCNGDSIFSTANANRWALKGDARMFGFAGANDAPIVADDAVPLSASQSKATIHAGTNAGHVDATLTSVTMQNGGVDHAQFAVTGATPVRVIHTPLSEGGLNIDENQIKTSIQTVFLKPSDVSLQETKGHSHKVFTNLSYTWDRDNWIPYLGVGGSAEFGYNKDCCDSDCSTNCATNCAADCESGCSSLDCALSQWSVWLKGGVSFD